MQSSIVVSKRESAVDKKKKCEKDLKVKKHEENNEHLNKILAQDS